MHPFRKPLATLAAALALAACGPQEPAPTQTPAVTEDSRTPAQREAERTPYELDAAFAKAGKDFGVPADLLKAISYTETRWEMLETQVEFEGMPKAYGLMALRGEKLSEGARLAGVSEEAVRTQPEANIRAAAALLSSYANELKLDRADVGAWAPAAAKYSGIDNAEAQAQYIHQGVYDVMRKGAVAQTPAGDLAVSLMPTQAQAKFPSAGVVRSMSADYTPAIWRPSPNYNSRPAGTDVSMIVIHTCEGSYSSCWSWLTNTASGVSAHYVVNESGSEISQLVLESNRGWHVGASYDCSLNGSVMCGLNGSSVNNFSVGIEHGGSASQTSFPAGQIDASAKLSCDITQGQGIVRDSYHIVAHGRLQPATRTDPGPNWPWSTYISKIQGYCGSTGTGSIIIDSNQANNDTSKGYVEVTGASWVSSTNVAGYYGSGYYAASTAAVSEPVTFYFYLPAAATKTIDAWWTSATDRSTTAPFIVYNAAGTKLATVNVNQQINGGRWNTLGTYSFSAGWNKVQLSRWTTAGYQVIADAVQVR
ncbi:transglycosylase-like protein with SLT domain [Archangium gephyra]|uniref:N-acetylmuramoyl-L-alanine amidase n=1 Tax=Archangium gephyra TaxID=48 RepID=A0AAC8Q1Y2_9BACT|nr:N-acetylmuramoyl-L-alanine amidase [Archangium gephyra]AKI99524.1 Negative regulator of beta-lactamase expression [Archangium gephyra]REG27934.1 transglycosylase-like protein with SLT domain [Archangium gephyra]